MAENEPTTPEEQATADRLAGWDPRFGDAPGDHGLPVEGLQVTDSPPPVSG